MESSAGWRQVSCGARRAAMCWRGGGERGRGRCAARMDRCTVSAPVAVYRLRGDTCVVAAGERAAAPCRYGGGDRVGVGCESEAWVGFRRIAADLDRPGETVRGWLRRFAE